MLTLIFAPIFIRQLNKLSSDLQEEVLDKLSSFENPKNHQQLKVHKLKGILKDRYSFYINYRYRVIFSYPKTNKNIAYILSVGDHDIYR